MHGYRVCQLLAVAIADRSFVRVDRCVLARADCSIGLDARSFKVENSVLLWVIQLRSHSKCLTLV